MSRATSLIAALLAASSTSVGCERVPAPPAGTMLRDSAGITVVHNPEGAWKRRSLRAGAAPVFDIGGTNADAAYSFSRVLGVRQLEDGRLVVADGESGEVRWFSPDGLHRGSAGGFVQPWLVGTRADDGVVIWEYQLRKITSLDAAGRVVDTLTLHGDARLSPWSVFNDGQILASSIHEHAVTPEGAVLQDTTTLWLLDATAGRRTLILRAPGLRHEVRGEVSMQIPFTANPVFDTHGDEVYITSPLTHVVERWSRAGTLEARFHEGREAQRLSGSDISRFRENELRGAKDVAETEELNQRLDEIHWPEYRPPYDRLLVDAGGRIWVRDYTLDRQAAYDWIVFGPGGEVLGTVRTPPHFEVMQITEGLLLGVSVDDDGTEHVRAYRVPEDLPAAGSGAEAGTQAGG